MKTIRLSQSIIKKEEAEAISRILLEDGYLGMGSEVKKFESEIADFIDIPANRIISVNSGTAALHLAVQSVTKPGDEILVQSLTFIASFQAISATGAIPVPCEVNPETITIDLNDAKKRLTSRTKAIMPVHYASYPGDLDEIHSFAKEHGLRVIEDAAHAFGCNYNGNKIGSFGDIICFSFDGIKNITSGEGGVVITADPLIAAQIRDTRLLGVEKDSEMRYSGGRSWEFDVKQQGYRYHMSNIFAALGRVQLRRLPLEFAPKRIELAKHYRIKLNNVPDLIFLKTNFDSVIPHIQPVRILNSKRKLVQSVFEKEGIQSGIHYKPNHLLSYYGNGTLKLPVTEQLYNELLSLPLHPGLTIEEVDHVCNVLLKTLK